MSQESTIAYFQSRFGGVARILPPAPYSRVPWLCPDVYIIAPHEARTHWILFTVGASRIRVKDSKKRRDPQYVELMMSLPSTWQCDKLWPPHVLRQLARIAVASDGPVSGFVFLDGIFDVTRPEHVFAVLIAPSRQLEQSAQFFGACGPTAVLAVYPLTNENFHRYRREEIDMQDIPEMIDEWTDMLRAR